MTKFGSGKRIRLTTDGLRGPDLLTYRDRRASRPTVLRPWHAECLLLRAADDRIEGKPLVRGRPAAGPDGRPAWVLDRRRRRMAVRPDEAEAERIGLWRVLEQVRREGQAGAGEPTIVAVELVPVTAETIDRACRWPRLPRKCSVARAAKLLGVSPDVVRLWVRMGKLVRRRARGMGRRVRYAVSYPRASLVRRRASGEAAVYPRRHRSLSGEMADADWARERFAREGRREWIVRVGAPATVGRHRGRGMRRRWVCPSCGRMVVHLYLPAGPLARSGRTWSPWRWQCRWCTGLVSEAGVIADGGTDSLGLWLLKETCGRLGGNEFRKYLPTVLSEEGVRKATEDMAVTEGRECGL